MFLKTALRLPAATEALRRCHKGGHTDIGECGAPHATTTGDKIRKCRCLQRLSPRLLALSIHLPTSIHVAGSYLQTSSLSARMCGFPSILAYMQRFTQSRRYARPTRSDPHP